MATATKKKARKPYTITRPRERWSADEHDRFLDALLLFGRDWKRIQRFVATKTAIQIRSHAQKHFLKARKLGLAVGLPPPPLHPRRAALLQANAAAADMMPPPWLPSAGGGSNSIGCSAPPSGVQQNMADWPPACYSSPDEASFRPLIHSSDDCSFIGTPNCSVSAEEWLGDAAFFLQDETILLPISPDDLGFAQVYKFVGDVFGSGERRPVEAHLRRLQGMDHAISETILLILKNLEANLAA